MVTTIADLVLRVAKERDQKLTPMQLMKLTYIANGYYLAVNNDSLFDDPIEAWKYGPVMPNLYHATKRFGRSEIPLDMVGDKELTEDLKKKKAFIEVIYNQYENKSGTYLSALTHQHGSPWHIAYEAGLNVAISPDSIKSHYEKKIAGYDGE